MEKGVYIIGTNTDIRKTFISGLILKKLREEGINAGYYKAVLSGAIKGKKGLISFSKWSRRSFYKYGKDKKRL